MRPVLPWRGRTFVLTLLILAAPGLGPTFASGRAGQVIAEFEIAPDGDFLRLPVVIREQQYSFLLNTGLATTYIDEELPSQLELYNLSFEFRPRRGTLAQNRFGGLRATLGKIPLDFALGVATANYSAMRDRLDLTCHGEIGMDVLQNHIVQIDFDRGVLRFLATLPPQPGEGIRITPLGGAGGTPTIPVTIPGLPREQFFVFTAHAGTGLEIRNELLARLVEREKVKLLDQEKGVARSGSRLFQTGRLNEVQLGKFRHEGVLVNSAEQNAVGIAYLARYIVTFDFPGNKLYLQKGRHFDDPDTRFNLWEVTLEREQEQPVIRAVHSDGPAQRLGLRAGDVVESINGCDAKRMSNWQVRRLLGREGCPLSAVVRRGTETIPLETNPPAAASDGEEK